MGGLLLGSALRMDPDIKKISIAGLAAMPIAMLLTFLVIASSLGLGVGLSIGISNRLSGNVG